MFTVTFKPDKQTRKLIKRIAVALERIARGNLTITGGEIDFAAITGENNVFTLPDDHDDVRFSVSPVTATDSENHPVALTELLESDNDDVVSFLFDEGSSSSNPRAGAAHIGAPGIANINYTATDGQGNIVLSKGAQFTITTGAVAGTAGGDLVFEGISES